MALIIKRNSMPAADALVADAVKAVPALNDFEKSWAHWEHFPAPDAPRRPCRFCGDNLIQRCRGGEHTRCLNFHVKRKRQKEKL